MSMAGRCIAASTASGMFVGPGMLRSSRPRLTVMVVDFNLYGSQGTDHNCRSRLQQQGCTHASRCRRGVLDIHRATRRAAARHAADRRLAGRRAVLHHGRKRAQGHSILTTGCNGLAEGLERRVTDDVRLRRIADAYEVKYGRDWRFTVKEGTFHHRGVHEGAVALVYELTPRKACSFGAARGASATGQPSSAATAS